MNSLRAWLIIGWMSAVAILSGSSVPGDEPAAALRVLSYNIHHGEGTDGRIDLERIARVIRSVDPHVVSLQEVDRGVRRSRMVDQPAELARLTEMTAVFERNIEYQGGDYGNAILTRLPVRKRRNHRLPSHYEGEQRGVLEVELEWGPGDRMLLFFATHLDYRAADGERRASVESIAELVADRAEVPAIVAGDLNAEPASAVLEAFARLWTVARRGEPNWTFPSREPAKQIDYILYRPSRRWRASEVRVLDEPVASDHRPIFASLELLP